MQVVMATDFAARERMALDARNFEERGAQWTRPQFRDTAPRTAQIGWVKHRVREYHPRVMASKKNFAHLHTRTAAVGKHEPLIAIGASQALKHDLHGYAWTALRNARGKRAAVYEPGAIAPRCNGRNLPVGVTGDGCHELRL